MDVLQGFLAVAAVVISISALLTALKANKIARQTTLTVVDQELRSQMIESLQEALDAAKKAQSSASRARDIEEGPDLLDAASVLLTRLQKRYLGGKAWTTLGLAEAALAAIEMRWSSAVWSQQRLASSIEARRTAEDVDSRLVRTYSDEVDQLRRERDTAHNEFVAMVKDKSPHIEAALTELIAHENATR